MRGATKQNPQVIKPKTKPQTTGGTERGIDNSFSSYEEESEESLGDMDESIKMAIQLSKEQEKIDKAKREGRGHPAMSETDGFNMAIAMSKGES